MPPIEQHVQTSLKRTGKEYREVHQWIDDPENKNDRHKITAIPDTFQMFKEQFGEEAAREYVQHLSDDIRGKFGHILDDLTTDMESGISYFGGK